MRATGALLLAHLLDVQPELFHFLVRVEQVTPRLQHLGAILEARLLLPLELFV
jgi:hypothetical protein